MLEEVEPKNSAEDGLSKPGLPQKTISLCPECLSTLPACLYEHIGRVWMRKQCPQHGEFIELISSDAEFFKQIDRWDWQMKSAIDEPITASQNNCPQDCGLCDRHESAPLMVVVNITNHCNLHCPICCTNSSSTGPIYELTVEQLKEMMTQTFTVSRTAPPCLQFSGGEPTIHPQFIDMIQAAREAGYARILAESNGLKFARDPAFAQAASDAGLNAVHLQFDGVDDLVYIQLRARNLLDIKKQAIENIQKAGMEIYLVPTLVKGINDHQIGDIFRFALDHLDAVTGIHWQPVAFTGRIDHRHRIARRFTTADLARELDRQTGGAIRMYQDWYPLSFVAPFSHLVEAMTGEYHPVLSCHRHCGLGNFIIVDNETKEYRPLTMFLDIEALLHKINQLTDIFEIERLQKHITLENVMKKVDSFLIKDRMLPGWDSQKLQEFLNGFINFRNQYPNNASRMQNWINQKYRSLTMVARHLQDPYNFEIPRVRRCMVHCIAADGRMYPFCTYNSGPNFRRQIESRFSWPRKYLTSEKMSAFPAYRPIQIAMKSQGNSATVS